MRREGVPFVLALALLVPAGCAEEEAGDAVPAPAQAPIPEPAAWDGRKTSEADAIVTLALGGEASAVLLNGEPARALIDNLARTARVLIPSSDEGLSCENSFIVTFADGRKGQLVANHCHSDDPFVVEPGAILSALVTKEDIDDPADDLPQDASALPLSFEWSANGFETLPGEFRWSGGSGDGGAFAVLGVPETDDTVFSAECSNGTVAAFVLLHDREPQPGMRETFRAEVEGGRVRTYPLEGVPLGEGAAFRLRLSASDPLWREMASGRWAFWQVGSDSGRGKLRLSLEGAAPHVQRFVEGC